MYFNLELNQLPYVQDHQYIIYIENDFDEEVNRYIRKNYEAIVDCFRNRYYRFIYFPKLSEELINEDVLEYYAPYADLSSVSLSISSNWLLDYMTHPENRKNIQPSLLYYHKDGLEDNKEAICQYRGVTIKDLDYSKTNDFSVLLDDIEKDIIRSKILIPYDLPGEEVCTDVVRIAYDLYDGDEHEEEKLKRLHKESERKKIDFVKRHKSDFENLTKELFGDENVDAAQGGNSYNADDAFPFESRQLVADVLVKIRELRQMGFNAEMLEMLIHQDEKISRLVITKKFDIILPDFHDKKIHMTPLCKALYLLFLRHPEGIMFSYLIDYHDELLSIYSQLRDGMITDSNRRSIAKLIDYTDNSINEKCARIREAFLKEFDERLANNYVIDGPRGEAKKIALPREMVIWE